MKRKNIILVGDFNCDMTSSLDSNESHFGKRFKRILCSYGLKNIINSPMCITFDSKSLIDLIVTSQPAKIQSSGSIRLLCNSNLDTGIPFVPCFHMVAKAANLPL